MARGSKKAYTNRQRRQADHIEESAKKSGKSSKTAERIAWATVNKESGGGKKSGSGRKKKAKKKTSTRKKKTSRKKSSRKKR